MKIGEIFKGYVQPMSISWKDSFEEIADLLRVFYSLEKTNTSIQATQDIRDLPN